MFKWLRENLAFILVFGLLLTPAAAAPAVNVVCLSGCSSGVGTGNNGSSGIATTTDNAKTMAWVYGYNGASWDQLQVDASKFLKVNCAAGCAGGTFNNNADAVATSATNGQTAAWLYGFNGATWDRLQVDGSKFLKINCAAGCPVSTFNNNADAVATSATNGQEAAWLYGFNGLTWDRLQVDASKFLKINCAAGCSGGTFNNNADNVATSATNGQSAAWLYGWDNTGSNWDRVQVNGSGHLLVGQGTGGNSSWLVGGGSTPADATSIATPVWLKAFSLGGVYNGASVDMTRAVTNGLNSTGTGLLAAGVVGQCDDVTPVATTENSFANAAIDCTNHTQLVGALVTTAAPTYTTGTSRGLSLTTGGGVRVSLADTASNTNPILVGDVDHDAVNTLKNVQIAGNANPADVPPTAVSANGDRVRAWMDKYGSLVVRPRKIRETYTTVFRLAETAARLDQTFTQVANTNKQWATLHHTAGATKELRLLKVSVYITAWSVASQAVLELRSINAAPATGNPAITPTVRRFGGTAAEATALYLPTTAGTETAVNSPLSSLIIDEGVMGAASTANPLPAQEIVLYNSATEDREANMPTCPVATLCGWAVMLRTVGVPAVRMTVVMTFDEEVP